MSRVEDMLHKMMRRFDASDEKNKVNCLYKPPPPNGEYYYEEDSYAVNEKTRGGGGVATECPSL